MSMYPCTDIVCRSLSYGGYRQRNGRTFLPMYLIEDYNRIRANRRPAYDLALALKTVRMFGGRIVATDGRVVRPYSPSDDAKANGETLSDVDENSQSSGPTIEEEDEEPIWCDECGSRVYLDEERGNYPCSRCEAEQRAENGENY